MQKLLREIAELHDNFLGVEFTFEHGTRFIFKSNLTETGRTYYVAESFEKRSETRHLMYKVETLLEDGSNYTQMTYGG